LYILLHLHPSYYNNSNKAVTYSLLSTASNSTAGREERKKNKGPRIVQKGSIAS
jgi:hypothetical protein